MRTLIVYYSLEGNTEYVAKKIADSLGADTLNLRPKKAYADKGLAKFLWGGKSALMAEKPELEHYEIHLADYDRIIFGFPVWASNFTPPIRTFLTAHLQELAGKHIAAFACQTASGAEKALAKLKSELQISDFEATAVFIDPKKKHAPKTDEEIAAFIKSLR